MSKDMKNGKILVPHNVTIENTGIGCYSITGNLSIYGNAVYVYDGTEVNGFPSKRPNYEALRKAEIYRELEKCDVEEE